MCLAEADQQQQLFAAGVTEVAGSLRSWGQIHRLLMQSTFDKEKTVASVKGIKIADRGVHVVLTSC